MQEYGRQDDPTDAMDHSTKAQNRLFKMGTILGRWFWLDHVRPVQKASRGEVGQGGAGARQDKARRGFQSHW